MYKFLITFLLFFCAGIANAQGVYRNASSSFTAWDYLPMAIWATDSLNNEVALTASDSVYLVVNKSDGSVAYSDSMLANDARITTNTREDHVDEYCFSDDVYTLTGNGSGANGNYVISMRVVDVSLALTTKFVKDFTLYTSRTYGQWLDSLYMYSGGTTEWFDGTSFEAKQDTLFWTLGAGFGMRYFNPGGNVDSVWYTNEAGDSIMVKLWYHPGGVENDVPDTVGQNRKP